MTTRLEVTVDHELEAAQQVMMQEIAWFKTLDDDTLERIADTAPLNTLEYEYATAELNRRAPRFSTRL